MSIINFTPFPLLSTERLTLRQFTSEDENEIFFMRSDEEMNKYTGITKASSLDDARKHIEKINNNIRNNESIMWGIALKDNNKLIGSICLWNIEVEKNQAEIGYVLMPAFQGKGIMQEAVTCIIDHGFNAMQLDTITADLEADNTASIKLLERTGFVYQGLLEIGVVYALSNKQ